MNIQLSKDSWHYRLATYCGFRQNYVYSDEKQDWVEEGGDMCSYTNRVLIGFVLIAVAAMIFYVVTAGIIQMLLGLAFSAYYGAWIMTPLGDALCFVTLVISAAGTLAFSFMKVLTYADNTKIKGSQPSFVKLAYRSWKDKYCVKISFSEK